MTVADHHLYFKARHRQQGMETSQVGGVNLHDDPLAMHPFDMRLNYPRLHDGLECLGGLLMEQCEPFVSTFDSPRDWQDESVTCLLGHLEW